MRAYFLFSLVVLSGFFIGTSASTSRNQIDINEAWLRQMTTCQQVFDQQVYGGLATSKFYKPPFAPSPFDSDGNSVSCEGIPGEP